MLIVLMSAFAVVLALDEYNDYHRMIEDLRMESCVELETANYEWDESGNDNGVAETYAPSLKSLLPPLASAQRTNIATPYISDKQKLGLVRRYAPRKDAAASNYMLT